MYSCSRGKALRILKIIRVICTNINVISNIKYIKAYLNKSHSINSEIHDLSWLKL